MNDDPKNIFITSDLTPKESEKMKEAIRKK